MKQVTVYHLLFIVVVTVVVAQKPCRNSKNRATHLASLWNDDLPYYGGEQPLYAVCDGTVTVDADSGEICVAGRVNYQQLMEFLDNRAVYQPAVRTISITGHLTAGSGNVVLGGRARYLYDFVTSYTVDNVTYSAQHSDNNIVDQLLAASRGTIDGVCFAAELQQSEERWYGISHDTYSLGGVDYDNLRNNPDIGLWFFGAFNSVVEYHPTNRPAPNFLSKILSRALLSFTNGVVYLVPSIFYRIVPVFAVTGTSRRLVFGTFSTKEYPNPFTAPDNLGAIEGVQIDTPWDNLVDAVQQRGLFTSGVNNSNKVPLYFNVVIKRIQPAATDNNFNCYGTGTVMAAIDVEAPLGRADEMDAFIENIVYPALSANNGTVGIHFGKRSPPNSSILQSALDVYEACGAKVGLGAMEKCYHPLCERKATPSVFEYPEAYYERR